MKTEILMALVAAGGFCCPIGTLAAEERVVISQPSIFWHNGEWQTYKDGVWTPYGQTPAIADEAPGGVDATSLARDGTILYFPPADGQAASPGDESAGTGGDPMLPVDQRLAHHHRRNRPDHSLPPASPVHPAHPVHPALANRGDRNADNDQLRFGIGQTTIGIGQPTIGIGQTTIGIGQTTIGIGQPTIGIGQPTIGIGQPTIGIGQPNSGPGNPNSGLGQPNGIGQPVKVRSPKPEARRKPQA